MAHVWVVEDNPKIQAHIVSLLMDEGHQVTKMGDAEAAQKRLLAGEAPELILLDIRLPGMSGIDLVKTQGNLMPPTIIISGEATISQALQALRLGVHDFIEKPFSDERFTHSVKNVLEKMALNHKVAELEKQLRSGSGQPILGESPAIAEVMTLIRKVAPTNGRVLITGESGTGKELVAATIHQLSRRNDKPFVKINCAAFPEHLIEAELFGYMKGAFTDARQNKMGLFEEAHGGTLFLDEIGDMDFGLQSRLLRVLEDGKVRRLGDTRERQVDVRVIAATNVDFEKHIRENRFREDLYYRLSTIPISVPPLRERGKDIDLLVAYYVEKFCKENQMRVKALGEDLLEALRSYSWPGNIRELRNLCERMVIFGGETLTEGDLPSNVLKGETRHSGAGLLRLKEIQPMPLKQFKEQCEKEFIETLLQRTNWNYIKVAKLLNINRSYLHQKVTSLGIDRKAGVR
jgi:DNA-binding NtrC family response regulator